MKKVTVMIVEDSRVICEFLQHIINRDPRLQVIAVAGSGEDALRQLAQVRPDVISLDIRLPGMNGLEATQRIMTEHPTPIVVVSSDVEDEELNISMNALRAGALAVVQKPVGMAHADYEKLSASLCTKLFIMSQVRVIRQRYRTYVPAAGTGGNLQPPPRISGVRPQVLALVASTGGPSALVRVLGDLAPGFNAPILLVQHITPGFVRGFVSWLGDVLPHLKVVEATRGMPLEPRTVYVAPANLHLAYAEPGTVLTVDTPPIGAQKPSGTVLFRSLAVIGSRAVGVLLTGMGEDGAQGMREMSLAGAYTIAEDESTAVVYGMPAAAVRLGGVSAVLPLPDIGPRINTVFNPLPTAHD
ncbi:MAG: Protein-glutamate methylesterase [Verrucomicrobiaceae bacterium]|nr:Protein-glutamate methylesterase [Verrucomicrobiaceae bacterium]